MPLSGWKAPYRIPNVFDNLIYRREMPVTIGVFINPDGHRISRNPQRMTGEIASTTVPLNTMS